MQLKMQGSPASGGPKRYRAALSRRFTSPAPTPQSRESVPTDRVASCLESWLLDLTSACVSPRTLEHNRFLIGRLDWWLKREGRQALDADALRDFLLYIRSAHELPEGRWGERGETREDHEVAARRRRGYKPASMRYKPVAARTVRNYWTILRAFVNWLVAQDIVSGIRMPQKAKAPTSDFRVFTREEAERLVETARGGVCASCYSAPEREIFGKRDGALMLLMLGTGLRASEVCALQWGDVDIAEGRLRVRSHDQGGGAKGNKSRTVHFHRDLGRALRAWFVCYPGAESDAAVFPSLGGGQPGQPMTRGGLLKLCKRVGEAAGVGDCRPHAYRHYFATQYLVQTSDLATLQEMLGHESVEMSRRYARFAEVDLAAKARRFHPLGGNA